MSASDKIALASLALSGISVVVTAIFSYLVWIVSKQNKDAAVLTAEIAKSTFEQQRIAEDIIKVQMRSSVLEKMRIIRNAVSFQNEYLDPNLLKKLPRDHGLTDYELSKYFSDIQLKSIIAFWNNFNGYLVRHFLDTSGLFKDLNQSDVQEIQEKSVQLRAYLDLSIDDLRNNL
jgi:hypothetical protein